MRAKNFPQIILFIGLMAAFQTKADVIQFAKYRPYQGPECRQLFNAAGLQAEIIPFPIRPRLLANLPQVSGSSSSAVLQTRYVRQLLGLKASTFGVLVPEDLAQWAQSIYERLSPINKMNFVTQMARLTNHRVNEVVSYSLNELTRILEFGKPPPYYNFADIPAYRERYFEKSYEVTSESRIPWEQNYTPSPYPATSLRGLRKYPASKWHIIVRDQVQSLLSFTERFISVP